MVVDDVELLMVLVGFGGGVELGGGKWLYGCIVLQGFWCENGYF